MLILETICVSKIRRPLQAVAEHFLRHQFDVNPGDPFEDCIVPYLNDVKASERIRDLCRAAVNDARSSFAPLRHSDQVIAAAALLFAHAVDGRASPAEDLCKEFSVDEDDVRECMDELMRAFEIRSGGNGGVAEVSL